MPQMAPLNWLMLFIMFIIIFMMFNFINYYSFMYLSKKNKFIKKNFKLNWKW
uniref:ATP synthase complex subunit 8 n=1 Tax=Staphylinidae sp. BMNH 1274704 TaxID=1796597 RepID=A0A140EFT1_9COLE|nr:ATP synthase F0 subunit 8 [Staphylinidae sp. BMNH 1274704]